MSVFDSLKKTLLGAQTPSPAAQPARAAAPEPDPDDLIIPEVDAGKLITMVKEGGEPLILDCRESWERKQVRIPGSLHIPMNETPSRLAELPQEQDIYVICAHGSRSVGVSGYLLQHGFRAINLRGGMADWQAQGGAVESDYQHR